VANFPEDIIPTVSYKYGLTYATLRSTATVSGVSQTRRGRFRGLFAASLKYENYLEGDVQTLWDFYVAQGGGFSAFTFTDFAGISNSPLGIKWPKLYVGTTNGVLTGWDLPMKSSSGYTTGPSGSDPGYGLFRAGTRLVSGTSYTFGSATGTDGRDKATGLTAGTAGDILEWRAVGRACFNVRFVRDDLTFEGFVANMVNTGLEVVEAP
jgi:hypothetical protein